MSTAETSKSWLEPQAPTAEQAAHAVMHFRNGRGSMPVTVTNVDGHVVLQAGLNPLFQLVLTQPGAAQLSEQLALASGQFRQLATATAALSAPVPQEVEGEEETYELGKRDGWQDAVQCIDMLTGGDGEYRYCTDHDPEQHCPDPDTMIRNIVDRFEGRQAQLAALTQGVSAVRARIRKHIKSWDGRNNDHKHGLVQALAAIAVEFGEGESDA